MAAFLQNIRNYTFRNEKIYANIRFAKILKLYAFSRFQRADSLVTIGKASSAVERSMRQIFRTFSITITVATCSAGATNAQTVSVLERVLGAIDNATNLAPVNGVYANIAENIGIAMVPQEIPGGEIDVVNPDAPLNTELLSGPGLLVTLDMVGAGDVVVSTDAFEASNDPTVVNISEDLVLTVVRAGGSNKLGLQSGERFTLQSGDEIDLAAGNSFVDLGAPYLFLFSTQVAEDNDLPSVPALSTTIAEPRIIYVPVAEVIDGSINNTVTGVVEATALATASLATATEFTLPTMDFGDMATTALGAVNTGDITLGVNSAVDEAQTSTTAAISAVMEQIGGSVDTGAIVINVASNANAINGSINNVLNQVNGSIGNISTTALGAVNTGTIVSGVDAAVQGIVGMSGQ